MLLYSGVSAFIGLRLLDVVGVCNGVDQVSAHVNSDGFTAYCHSVPVPVTECIVLLYAIMMMMLRCQRM